MKTYNKTEQKEQKEKDMPLFKCKAGCVTGTIWENKFKVDNKEISTLNITIERNYKKKDGSWEKTSQFRTADLPKLALVAQKCYEHALFHSSDDEQ